MSIHVATFGVTTGLYSAAAWAINSSVGAKGGALYGMANYVVFNFTDVVFGGIARTGVKLDSLTENEKDLHRRQQEDKIQMLITLRIALIAPILIGIWKLSTYAGMNMSFKEMVMLNGAVLGSVFGPIVVFALAAAISNRIFGTNYFSTTL